MDFLTVLEMRFSGRLPRFLTIPIQTERGTIEVVTQRANIDEVNLV